MHPGKVLNAHHSSGASTGAHWEQRVLKADPAQLAATKVRASMHIQHLTRTKVHMSGAVNGGAPPPMHAGPYAAARPKKPQTNACSLCTNASKHVN